MTNIQKNKAIVVEMVKKGKNLTKDESRTKFNVEKIIAIDGEDIKLTNKHYEYYLHLAVGAYVQSLLVSSESETNESNTMFRLFSLWFSNSSDEVLLSEIQESHERIPTYKFIPLMPQITTHLSTEGIQDVIADIICKNNFQSILSNGIHSIEFFFYFYSAMCFGTSASCAAKSNGTCQCIQRR